MKKLALALGVVGLLACGGLFWMYSNLGSLVKKGVETFGPEILKAPVTIQSVRLSPFSGKGSIKGLVIGNPKGFKTSSAFELGEVRIAIAPKSLATNLIVIDEISVIAPKVTYELARGGSNVAVLQRNVEAFAAKAGATGSGGSAESSKSSSPSPKIRIGLFQFADGEARVSAKMLNGKVLKVPLPSIKLTDIGGKKGTSPAKAAAKVMKTVTGSVTVAAKGALKNVGALAKEGVKAAKDQATKAIKGLKGLFKK
jgi:uncharacterized protein involved in outer membrane biogenesis